MSPSPTSNLAFNTRLPFGRGGGSVHIPHDFLSQQAPSLKNLTRPSCVYVTDLLQNLTTLQRADQGSLVTVEKPLALLFEAIVVLDAWVGSVPRVGREGATTAGKPAWTSDGGPFSSAPLLITPELKTLVTGVTSGLPHSNITARSRPPTTLKKG